MYVHHLFFYDMLLPLEMAASNVELVDGSPAKGAVSLGSTPINIMDASEEGAA